MIDAYLTWADCRRIRTVQLYGDGQPVPPGQEVPGPVPASSPCIQPRRRRTLGSKYSQFTAVVLTWVATVFIAWDLHLGRLDFVQIGLLAGLVPAVAYALSRFTNHLLAAPLVRLEEGIRSVETGRLEPIQVSETGDEIEYLGHQLNRMIEKLRASQAEVAEHQEMLEARIRERTVALEAATRKAMSANRAKSEFLANISHELRTPMNGILGMLDIVLDDELPPAHREQLDIAKGCANTLLALLNDLLDLSKIEAGKMMLEHIAFDVRLLAEDCTRDMQLRARQKGIELEFFAEPGVPARILGDPLRLRQILYNLLSNAVKFTEKGRVDILMAATGKAGKEWLTLTVRDTGAGIAPGKLEDIFEDFTQADGSVSRRYGGTGLGLAITRRLVKMHGGSIHVDSRVGEGSTFRVEMPVERPAAEAPAPVAANNPSPAAADPAAAPRLAELSGAASPCVLVAEDNLVNQRVVAAILSKQGYRVVLAGNGRDALAMMNRHKIDAVLMDVQMPEIDGITATRLIRENPAWTLIPVIALTAHAMQGDREKCLEAGMNDYLPKPVTPKAVVESLRRHLRAAAAAARSAAPSGAPHPPIAQPSAPHAGAGTSGNNLSIDAGMARLFVQLAPERLEQIQSAAARQDAVGLQAHAQKLAAAAETVEAGEAARRARELARDAHLADAVVIHDHLRGLHLELRRLGAELRAAEESAC